jgi:DNA-binding NarL/FixJ family response regulator
VTTRIQLVDDHRIVLEGLRSLLQKRRDLEVVAESKDGLSALRLASETKPDLVVVDVTLPGMSGIELTRRLVKMLPDTRVIALSMHSDAAYVAEMLQAGATGYVLKDDDFDELLVAIDRAISGQRYLSSAIADRSVGDFLGGTGSGNPYPARLTARERELLHWLAEGETIKQIATRLNLSPKTLYTHRENVMRKLRVTSSAGLLKLALMIESPIL